MLSDTMSDKCRNIGTVLIGCILMILASASTVWLIVGIKMLEKITFLDVYYVIILNALLPAGTVVGAVLFCTSADLIGRKMTLLAIAVPYAGAFLIFQFARSIAIACIGRAIAGLAVGGTHAVLPIYIAEIAEPSNRGILGTLMTISALIGVAIYYVIAAYGTYTIFNTTAIGISIIFFVLFFFVGRESKYYYIRKNKRQELNNSDETKFSKGNKDFELMFARHIKVMSCLGPRGWLKSLIIMHLLLIIHHFSGVSMIPMLLQYIVSYMGYMDINIHYHIVLLASVGLELLGSVLCMLLIDRIGRKACLIISTVCIAVFYIPIAIFAAVRERYLDIDPIPALTIVFVVMFLLFFYIGIAPVPAILLGELFPLRMKMVVAAYMVSIQQVTIFVVTNYFQEIASFIGYTVILFVCLAAMWIAPVLIYFGLFETRKRSLREIQIILKN